MKKYIPKKSSIIFQEQDNGYNICRHRQKVHDRKSMILIHGISMDIYQEPIP